MRSEQEVIAELQSLLGGGQQQTQSQPQSPSFLGLGLKKATIGGMTYGSEQPQPFEKEIEKQKATSELANNEMMGLLGNLASNLKAVNIEQGGAGPVQGMLGKAAAFVGAPDTGNIVGLKGTVRDTAIKMAQRLSGGNRGATLIFSKVLESIPTGLNTENQQASTINDLAHTALALQKASKNLGNDAISKMKPEDLKSYILTNALTPEEDAQITGYVADMLKNTKPRASMDMGGNVKEPSTNPVSGIFFKNGKKSYSNLWGG